MKPRTRLKADVGYTNPPYVSPRAELGAVTYLVMRVKARRDRKVGLVETMRTTANSFQLTASVGCGFRNTSEP